MNSFFEYGKEDCSDRHHGWQRYFNGGEATPYLDNELNRISQEWGTPRSEIIRVVLMNFISEMNDSIAQMITDRIESLRHERID